MVYSRIRELSDLLRESENFQRDLLRILTTGSDGLRDDLTLEDLVRADEIRRINVCAQLANGQVRVRDLNAEVHPKLNSQGRFMKAFDVPKRMEQLLTMDSKYFLLILLYILTTARTGEVLERFLRFYDLTPDTSRRLNSSSILRNGSSLLSSLMSSWLDCETHPKIICFLEFLGVDVSDVALDLRPDRFLSTVGLLTGSNSLLNSSNSLLNRPPSLLNNSLLSNTLLNNSLLNNSLLNNSNSLLSTSSLLNNTNSLLNNTNSLLNNANSLLSTSSLLNSSSSLLNNTNNLLRTSSLFSGGGTNSLLNPTSSLTSSLSLLNPRTSLLSGTNSLLNGTSNLTNPIFTNSNSLLSGTNSLLNGTSNLTNAILNNSNSLLSGTNSLLNGTSSLTSSLFTGGGNGNGNGNGFPTDGELANRLTNQGMHDFRAKDRKFREALGI